MRYQIDTASRTERLLRLGVLQEPLGYVDGANAYEYVRCNPVGGVDPLGLAGTQPDSWLFGEHSTDVPYGKNAKSAVRIKTSVRVQSPTGSEPKLIVRFEVSKGKDWSDATIYRNLLHDLEGNRLYHSDTAYGVILVRSYAGRNRQLAQNGLGANGRTNARWLIDPEDQKVYDKLYEDYYGAESRANELFLRKDDPAVAADLAAANQEVADLKERIAGFDPDTVYTEYTFPIKACKAGRLDVWFWYSHKEMGSGGDDPLIAMAWTINWDFNPASKSDSTAEITSSTTTYNAHGFDFEKRTDLLWK
jgi:hypothetical protein